MNGKLRVLAAMMAIFAVMGFTGGAVAADSPGPIECIENTCGNIDVTGIRGRTGETVSVDVAFQSAPNDVDAFGFEVTFDPDAVAFLDGVPGSLVIDKQYNFELHFLPPNTVRCGAYKSGSGSISQGNSGNIAHFTFEILADPGQSEIGLANLKDDIAGWPASGGCLSVLPDACGGDVNGDGEITPGDALLAFEKYMLFCPTYTGMACNDVCCDVNGDQNCTPSDALCIFRAYLRQPNCLDRNDGDLPVVYITGPNPIELCVGDTYADPGVRAVDAQDGPIPARANQADIDTSVVGNYHVVYEATDSDGNTAVGERTVIVQECPETYSVNLVLPDSGKLEGTSILKAVVTDSQGGPVANVAVQFEKLAWGEVIFSPNPVITDETGTATTEATLVTCGPHFIPIGATAQTDPPVSCVEHIPVGHPAPHAPAIHIAGNSLTTICVGDTYEDDGAIAVDYKGMEIPAYVVVNDVNPMEVGRYQVVYEAVDSEGNMAVATRSVDVDPCPDLPDGLEVTLLPEPDTLVWNQWGTLKVKALDGRGNPVENVDFEFFVPFPGEITFSPDIATTDASGVATVEILPVSCVLPFIPVVAEIPYTDPPIRAEHVFDVITR